MDVAMQKRTHFTKALFYDLFVKDVESLCLLFSPYQSVLLFEGNNSQSIEDI
jgi:hypothetical protein